MLRSASIRSATTASDSLMCFQDDPKTPQRRLPGFSKTPAKRSCHGSKPPPRRTTTPSGWSQLRLAGLKAAKKPSKLRFWTPWTSNLDPPGFDFKPSIRRFSILQKDRQNAALLLFVLARWRGRSFAARWINIFCWGPKPPQTPHFFSARIGRSVGSVDRRCQKSI